ncbi:MAG: hypothetical protein V3V95_08655 [Thermodesulfobacteriota bacterium]
MQKVAVRIVAEDKFSNTITALNTGLEAAVANILRLGTEFETATDKAGNLLNRPGMNLKNSSGVNDASPAEGTGALDGNGAPSQVDQRQAELEQRAQHNTTLLALEREHKRRTLDLDKATWDTKFKTAATATSTMANLMQNLYVATGSKNKAMFEAGKAFAIAETIINTRAAAMGAYKSLSGIPLIGPALGVAAAAAALAAGAAHVQEISSTHPGGGSISAGGSANPSYSGGSPSAYPIPQRFEAPDEKLTQHITVHIHTLEGSEVNWQKIAEDNIKPALENLKDRNVSLDILTT